MTRRIVLVLVWVCAVGVGNATAQSDATSSAAEPYFHEAAQAYIDNNLPTARRAVAQGLEVAPSDPRLLALREKLRQTRPSDRDPNQSADAERRQQQSSNQRQSSSDGGRSASDTGSRERQQAGAQTPEPAEGTGARSPYGEEPREGESEGEMQRGARDGASSGERRPTGRLSRAQAEQLLRALEVQEQHLLRTLQPRDGERRSVEKDW